jgi:hypothetical protein
MAVFTKESKMLEILPQGMNPSAADRGASWIQKPGKNARFLADSCWFRHNCYS